MLVRRPTWAKLPRTPLLVSTTAVVGRPARSCWSPECRCWSPDQQLLQLSQIIQLKTKPNSSNTIIHPHNAIDGLHNCRYWSPECRCWSPDQQLLQLSQIIQLKTKLNSSNTIIDAHNAIHLRNYSHPTNNNNQYDTF